MQQSVTRGRWFLDAANAAVSHSHLGAAWWLDLRNLHTPLDVFEIVRLATDKCFVSYKDVADLIEVMRVYLRDRPRR